MTRYWFIITSSIMSIASFLVSLSLSYLFAHLFLSQFFVLRQTSLFLPILPLCAFVFYLNFTFLRLMSLLSPFCAFVFNSIFLFLASDVATFTFSLFLPFYLFYFFTLLPFLPFYLFHLFHHFYLFDLFDLFAFLFLNRISLFRASDLRLEGTIGVFPRLRGRIVL